MRRFDFHKKKRLRAFLLTVCLCVASCFGGAAVPSYADGDDTTTEAAGGDKSTDVSSSIMKNKNGMITFWEWKKVTRANHESVMNEAARATGNDYVASMFVMLDEKDKPLCFLSTYADNQHIFLGDGVRSMQETFDTFGSGDGLSMDAATKQMNGSTLGGVDGTLPPNTSFRNVANVFIKEDMDGFSLKDNPEYFTRDTFYTSGRSMGVLWAKRLYSSAGNPWNYRTFREEYDMGVGDWIAAIYSGGVYMAFKDKEKVLETQSIPGLSVDYVRVDLALSRPSAKNAGDQSYRTIGKKLNGNYDYYLYSSGNNSETGSFNALARDDQRKITEVYQGGYKTTGIGASMPVEIPQMNGKDPVRYDMVYTPGFLIPYRADNRDDRWTLRGGMAPFSDYLCYYNGYIQSIGGEYFLTAPTGGKKYADEDTFELGGERIFPNSEKALNSLGSMGKAKNISNKFYWYVGTPHTFAALVGEGGDPVTGVGSTLTVPAGQTLVVKDTEYADASGNISKSDGVVLPEGATIVIEDGGVLSVEGNFINNGKIINKGGTILVKEGGTISPYLTTSEGTIECCKAPGSGRSGDLIIMPGGKLFCLVDADSYERKKAAPALKLTGGGTVINYGTLVMSYAEIDIGSKIENRKDAVCFAGYNRTSITAMLHKSGANKKSVAKIEVIPKGYVTTDDNDPNPYHTGVTGVATIQNNLYEREVGEQYRKAIHALTGKVIPKTETVMTQRIVYNKGTILTEKTATFNHVNGTVDFAPTSRINLETPEY